MSETTHVAKKMAETSANALAGASERMSSALAMNSEFIEALSAAGRSYFEGVTAFNEELLNFTNQRLAEASKTRDILMQCRDVNDVVRVQQDWLLTASERYFGEVSRLVDLGTQTMLSAVSPLIDRAGDISSEDRKEAEAA